MNPAGPRSPRIFDLLVEPKGSVGRGHRKVARYRAKVLRSPHGEAEHLFQLPWKPEEVNLRLEAMGVGRDPAVGGDSGPGKSAGRSARRRFVEQAGAQVGEELFRAVFGGRVEQVFRISLEICQMQKERLVLRLRFGEDPRLPALPWEMLWDPQRRSFLAASRQTSLVRYSEEWVEESKLPDLPPIQILVVSACPAGLPGIDAEKEWKGIETALGDLVDKGRVVLDRMENATASSLLRQLRGKRYHVLHFIGHGEAGGRGSGPALFFEGSDGSPDRLQQGRVRALLEEALRPSEGPQLKLVVLNSCEGARESGTVLLDSLASELVRLGVPAVVAMQFVISDRAARLFAGDLYGGLADGLAIEQALGRARTCLLVEGEPAWATPVLYLRSVDGRLFSEESLAGKGGSKRPGAGALSALNQPLVWAGTGVTAAGLLLFFFLVILPLVQSFDGLRRTSPLGLVDGELAAGSEDGRGAGDELGATYDEVGAASILPDAGTLPNPVPPSDEGCPTIEEMPRLLFGLVKGGLLLRSEGGENVEVEVPFCIGRTEVTVDQWNYVMADDMEGRGDLPAASVSPEEADAFVAELNRRFADRFGGRFRLPSEPEWELAAAADSIGPYGFKGGEPELPAYGNCRSTVGDENEEGRGDDGFDGPAPVASFKPNARGLFDFHGNVWEWTSGREGDLRVRRGGSFYSKPENCRLDARDLTPPNRGWSYWGMRLVWEPDRE